MKTRIGILFSLYEASTGKRLATHSVTGQEMTPVLEEIANIVNGQGKNVSLQALKVRINENKVMMDPAKMDSLSAMLTLASEHYEKTSNPKSKVIVESSTPFQKSMFEHLAKVLSDPKKKARLVAELSLPDLDVGDTLLVGKFKNRKAEIKGFETDANNQPVALTTKGPEKVFKPRVAKIMHPKEPKPGA